MLQDTSVSAKPAELGSIETGIHARSGFVVWLTAICVAAYCAVFFWASGRGYEFFDEAFDLATIADPSAYSGVSDFGHLWHPLYAALNGSIALLRIAGFLIVSACGALFGVTVARFSDARARFSSTRFAIVLGVTICVSWQYQTWKATPDYNMLNLCALLLFFSGLLDAARFGSMGDGRSSFYRDTLGPAALCGVGITLMALAKGTTAVLAVVLGFAWVVLLRPRRPFACIILTGLLAAVLLAIAMIVIDGDISTFIDHKIRAFEALNPPGTRGDVHGIMTSVAGPFSKERWKIAEALISAAILFALGLAWSCLLTSVRSEARWRWAAHVIAAVIAILVLWWRDQDIQYLETFMGFRLWRLPLAFVLIAFAMRILWLKRFRIDRSQARILMAAGLLAVAPVAYSFGTDNLLIWHMAGAGIFWAAAMMVLTALLPGPIRENLWRAIALLCGMTSVGLLLSVMITPGRIGAPVWEQTVTVRLGRQASRLAVNAVAADYIRAFQSAARAGGFAAGTPVIDLSEMGLGLSFALGGRPLGAPPWLISNGALARESERRGTIALQAAGVPRHLADVQVADLRRAWVITGDPMYLDLMQPVLISLGLNFPEGYRAVSRAKRSDLGWGQVLWKPLR